MNLHVCFYFYGSKITFTPVIKQNLTKILITHSDLHQLSEVLQALVCN